MNMLFTPYKIKDLELKNRIVMPPMCQYEATEEGKVNDWHFVHYVSRAVGGTGLIIQEATAVEPIGRITDRDLGIWSKSQVVPMMRLVGECKRQGAKIGIQLAHAGRKSESLFSTPVAPSPIAFGNEYRCPKELTVEEIKEIEAKFAEAAERALKIGYDVIEIHAAHGYLINEFLSPLTNKRTDEYGGSLENRVRFLREILHEIHKVWPVEKPVFVRVSAEEYAEGGINTAEMIKIVNMIKSDGVDLIHVSSGGLAPVKVHAYPGYQVGFSREIRKNCSIPTIAVGLIAAPDMAEGILQSGDADLVALGRELLRNPYWPLYASKKQNQDIQWPKAYERAR